MDLDKIKFSTNWNNKLDCNCFTTIRLFGRKYSIGKTFEIILKENHLCSAIVQDMIVTKMEFLNDFNCFIDTGYSKIETEKLFKKMYPSINFESEYLVIVLLKKL